jgi:hypothetical protein
MPPKSHKNVAGSSRAPRGYDHPNQVKREAASQHKKAQDAQMNDVEFQRKAEKSQKEMDDLYGFPKDDDTTTLKNHDKVIVAVFSKQDKRNQNKQKALTTK